MPVLLATLLLRPADLSARSDAPGECGELFETLRWKRVEVWEIVVDEVTGRETHVPAPAAERAHWSANFSTHPYAMEGSSIDVYDAGPLVLSIFPPEQP